MEQYKTNPYTLTFGKSPFQTIPRSVQENMVLESLKANPPSNQAIMITGIRGVGKTVFMSRIQNDIRKSENWETVELNPQRDMLMEFASKLSSKDSLARIFRAAKINLSFFGLGVEIEGQTPISDIEVALERMISSLAKKGKKILVTIDEVTSSEYMRVFAAAFQILIRRDLPVFLVMTGIYENINELQNEKSLTFLYRVPKIELGSLNIGVIADNYKKVIGIDDGLALKMARLTKGYAFAFQVLGYFSWENKGDLEKSEPLFKQYLDDYVYDKIWSELSRKDRFVLSGMAQVPEGKISDIKEILKMETNEFNPYRSRLIKKGIISGDERGYVRFVLPLFERYIEEHFE